MVVVGGLLGPAAVCQRQARGGAVSGGSSRSRSGDSGATVLARREMHEKYVVMGERMESLVKEERAVREAAHMESEAARIAVQAGSLGMNIDGRSAICDAWRWNA